MKTHSSIYGRDNDIITTVYMIFSCNFRNITHQCLDVYGAKLGVASLRQRVQNHLCISRHGYFIPKWRPYLCTIAYIYPQ